MESFELLHGCYVKAILTIDSYSYLGVGQEQLHRIAPIGARTMLCFQVSKVLLVSASPIFGSPNTTDVRVLLSMVAHPT